MNKEKNVAVHMQLYFREMMNQDGGASKFKERKRCAMKTHIKHTHTNTRREKKNQKDAATCTIKANGKCKKVSI